MPTSANAPGVGIRLPLSEQAMWSGPLAPNVVPTATSREHALTIRPAHVRRVIRLSKGWSLSTPSDRYTILIIVCGVKGLRCCHPQNLPISHTSLPTSGGEFSVPVPLPQSRAQPRNQVSAFHLADPILQRRPQFVARNAGPGQHARRPQRLLSLRPQA